MFSYLSSLFQNNPTHLTNIKNLHQDHYSPQYAYLNNVIVYKCVNMISLTASQVPFVSLSKNKLVQELLQSPNSIEDWSSWVKTVIANRVLYGTAFILFEGDQLISVSPDAVHSVIENKKLIGYKYGNRIYKLKNEDVCQMMKIKNFNPISSAMGISPVRAANDAIKLYNKVVQWNISLVQNGARPSGAFIVNQPLTKQKFDEISKQIEEKITGEANAGMPIILNGMDWKEMSINHSDMEFQESKKTSARDIALAFGIPPVLLGIQGDSTYNNLKEARIALWEETIMPILKNLSFILSKNLSTLLKEKIEITCAFDQVSSLAAREAEKFKVINQAKFMKSRECKEQGIS